MDVESVDCSAVAFRSRSDQGFAALRLLDNIQYWVFGICGLFVTEIHACGEANVDAAGGEPEIDVRRHYLAALATCHTSRFDGADRVETGGEIRPGPRPATKALVERLILLVRRMIVTAGGIGLARFNQHVLCNVARAVEDPPFDDNTLARHAGACDVAAEIILEDFKAGLLGYETDVDVGAGRLRWRLRQIGRNERRRCHVSSPAACFRTRSGGVHAVRCRGGRGGIPAAAMH